MLIECGTCQCQLDVPASAAGTQEKCPKCGTVLTIPAAVMPSAAANDDPSDAATVDPNAAGTPELTTVAGAAPGQAATESLYAFLAPPQAADELGRLGGYRVLRVLGRGGMGVVFLAEDPRLGRQVALKAMLPDLANKASFRERFLREARTAAAIEHDHIVAIYQVDEDRGVPFIAMPLLKGCSFEDWLRAHHDRPLPVPLILKLGKQVAEGLAAAHAHGLIHRDIKPANIFLQNTARAAPAGGQQADLSVALSLTVDDGARTADFRVKVLDFGLARSSAGEQNLTLSGDIMGTPAYMAPEQARSGSKVDARADLFSLGVVLYRLCTGKRPFQGEDLMGTLMALAMDTPTAPAALNLEVPLALSDLVMHLLAKDPKDRVGSAEEVVKALAAIEATLRAVPAPVNEAPTEKVPVDHPAPVPVTEARTEKVPIVHLAPVADPFEPAARENDDLSDDDDLQDLRALKNEDTMLSMISMIVGIVSAVCGVLSACCCGAYVSPVAGIGGAAAIVLGVLGYKRGGRNYAIIGMSLGAVGVLLALSAIGFTVLDLGRNFFAPGRKP